MNPEATPNNHVQVVYYYWLLLAIIILSLNSPLHTCHVAKPAYTHAGFLTSLVFQLMGCQNCLNETRVALNFEGATPFCYVS